MTFSRALIVVSVILFGTIGFAAWQKQNREFDGNEGSVTVDIPLPEGNAKLSKADSSGESEIKSSKKAWPLLADHLPKADRVQELFNTGLPQLPIVQTLSYSSRVPWLKGRPAWISDYASHYKTSRHFIARSLNGIPDYLTQNVSNKDNFTVFREDCPVSFHLLVDASRCKMWFYYHDEMRDEKTLLKVYDVGLGRLDPSKASGMLTPLGTYQLGDRVAVYKPGIQGNYLGDRVEMISVFGTRWVPFDKIIGGHATAPAKGYGIHGTPWKYDETTNAVADSLEGIGGYESDGCIRLRTDDIEEIFAIIVTKPTFIHIVRDFADADLPGIESSQSEA